MKILNYLLIASFALYSCGKKSSDDSTLSVDSTEASIESGMTFISGMADDQNGSSFALVEKPQSPFMKILMGETAYAAACTRAVTASCLSGIKSTNYNSCSISGTAATMTGSVSLQYSNGSCLMSSNGDSVNRTYSLQITGPRGGSLSHSSLSQSDYRGTTYGGGGTLTKTASGWDIAIAGRHTELKYKDKSIFNVSIRTLSNLGITGSLSRAGRTWNSGQLEVNHNNAKFTSTITPNNVQWSSTCCHPTSGSLTVMWSGSKSGSSTVTFNGCGTALVNENGQTRSIEMSYCE